MFGIFIYGVCKNDWFNHLNSFCELPFFRAQTIQLINMDCLENVKLDSPPLNPYAFSVAEKAPRWKLYALFGFVLVITVFFLRDTYWQTTLTEREFMALYVEVVRLQSRLADKPEEARAQTKEFLRRAGVTEEEIERFIALQNRTPERWAKIWEKIVKELEKARPARDATLPKNR